MSDGPISIRLGKAATEFNVGVTTIVDFLHKRGHKIDSNPNTKLSPEMHTLLVKEYQPDKAAKDIAKHIELEYQAQKAAKAEEKKPLVEEVKPVKETVAAPPVQEKTPVIVPVAPKPAVVEATVVEKAPEVKVAPQVVPEVVAPAKPSAPTAEVVKDDVKVANDMAPQEKAAVVAETVKPSVPTIQAETELTQKVVVAENPVAQPVVTPAVTEPEASTDSDETVSSGPKVLGKIDLKQFDKKPKKKEKGEKVAEKDHKKEAIPVTAETETPVVVVEKVIEQVVTPAAPVAPEVVVATEPVPQVVVEEAARISDVPSIDGTYNKSDSNYLQTKFTKLEGPKILSKIELPQPSRPEPRKPVASSSDEDSKSKKRKRKRLNKGKNGTDAAAPGATPGTTTPRVVVPAKLHDRTKAKPGAKSHTRTILPKAELTEEDIQKQIKETLQRLSGTGKSKASKYRREKRNVASQHMQEEVARAEEDKLVLKVTEFVTANDLSVMMDVPVTKIIATCMTLGMFVSINQRLDAETISVLADEFGYKVEFVSVEVQEAIDNSDELDDPALLKPRNPIVTVMGHVDHGKTSLLDHIRSANVIAGEAGGITQHIGAYEVQLEDGRKITFLDTPGHEAFTAMRARGAQVTDLVIIVVAADDTVMPQTKEAINHAQAAGVPMVFAINKIDKNGANPEKIKEELSKLNILVEDWGGKYQSQEISAKKGINVTELLDKVLLEAELLDLHANPDARASGTVIESSLDKGRGYVAKLLVQNGTLKLGDFILAGSVYGKVKAMYNERNLPVKEAGPSAPVLLLGLTGAPQAGDKFKVMVDEREAKQIATKRQQLQREQGIRTQKHITLDEIGRRIAIGDFKELNIIVKADVDGSVEALSDSLLKLSTPQVQVNVIHKSVGAITESDVLLASASNAIIAGFQVRPSMSARKLAEREEIDIRFYSIIYTAINEIKLAIEGMLAPEIEEKIVCNVEIREVFKNSKVGSIAGCMVLDGKITRNTRIRVIRDGIVVHAGSLGSLKRFKDDVKEVLTGYECGLNIDNFNDIKIGDIVEGYEEVEVKRKL
ncbi:MAG: translation initiation factor IF-2 [Bacteroidales bacterium]|nr:translation initiation factor IF-2 [Bacteroidales bacterium]